MPSEPAAPIPGDEANPDAAPDKSSEMMPSAPDEASPPSQSTEAPLSPSFRPSRRERLGSPKFLTKQESSDMLACNLIGQSVVNCPG